MTNWCYVNLNLLYPRHKVQDIKLTPLGMIKW